VLRSGIGFLQDALLVFGGEPTALGFHDDFRVGHIHNGLTITRTGID